MQRVRIGICAPSTPLTVEQSDKIRALASNSHPKADLAFADQCFAVDNHFAGSDQLRRNTFIAMANDPQLDAIWFARGGYGAARVAEDALPLLDEHARQKTYLGYSDGGNLLGALYKAGIGKPVHGPMPVDIVRNGGEVAVRRSLDWLTEQDPSALEKNIMSGQKYAAFNLMTLAMIVGTPLMPELRDHILMIEEVSEYLYAFDRAMFNITSNLKAIGLTGIRLGRVSQVPDNDRPFGESAEEIVLRWCQRSGIAYLGQADIGHDSDNKIVPFGMWS